MAELILDPLPTHAVLLPHPFRMDKEVREVPEGATVLEILASCGLSHDTPVVVQVDGRVIERAQFASFRPRRGAAMSIRVLLEGGGSGGGKQTLRIILLIVVVVVVTILTAGAGAPLGAGLFGTTTAGVAATAATAAALTVGGTLLVNALVPPPAPPSQNLGNDGRTQNAITGTRNSINKWGTIPGVLGAMQIFPCFHAVPFSEVESGKVVLRCLYNAGPGPLKVEKLKIGSTSLSQFKKVDVQVAQPGEFFKKVTDFDLGTVETVTPPVVPLYPRTIHEEPFDVTLRSINYQPLPPAFPGGPAPVDTRPPLPPGPTRAARTNSSAFSIDLTFKQGLAWYKSDGTTKDVSVKYRVGFRLASTAATNGAWTYITAADGKAHFTLDKTSRNPFVRTIRGDFPSAGDYEVKVERITPDAEDDQLYDRAWWTMLRSYDTTPPLKLDAQGRNATNFTFIALKITANNQLSGILDSVNCLATVICDDWDASSATWIKRPTSNPASLYRYILQSSENKSALANSKVDLATLQAWYVECVADGREFNATVEQARTVHEMLKWIASIGRASFDVKDGSQYSVVRDITTTALVGITPRNSWGFTGQKTFVNYPHALRVLFIDKASWQQVERVVYDDGYSKDGAGGTTAATLFEILDLQIACSPEQAYKMGRYTIAAARLRPEVYTVNMDWENLAFTRGDTIWATSDVTQWGVAHGRVKTVVLDGSGNALGVVVDEFCPMSSGSYVVQFRNEAGLAILKDVVTVSGGSFILTFATSIPAASTQPKKGDLFLFGDEAPGVKVKVKEIVPGPDLSAQLVLVDEAPAIQTAASGAIPAFDPQITLEPERTQIPPAPIVSAVARYVPPAGTRSQRGAQLVLVLGPQGNFTSRVA